MSLPTASVLNKIKEGYKGLAILKREDKIKESRKINEEVK